MLILIGWDWPAYLNHKPPYVASRVVELFHILLGQKAPIHPYVVYIHGRVMIAVVGATAADDKLLGRGAMFSIGSRRVAQSLHAVEIHTRRAALLPGAHHMEPRVANTFTSETCS